MLQILSIALKKFPSDHLIRQSKFIQKIPSQLLTEFPQSGKLTCPHRLIRIKLNTCKIE